MLMKHLCIYSSFLFLCVFNQAWGKPLVLSDHQLASPPPRIIRTCCSFGSDVGVMVVPFIKVTDITCIGNLGNHQFLGNNDEGNGIIYTGRGGFIDMGHLRDQADWTAYLYALIIKNKSKGYINQPLGREGGEKDLRIDIPSDLSDCDAMQLAGRIAYDLSVWHEIATWYGASYIPMVPERYSSFSVEDAYSNLLGVTLGIEALKSPLPYEQAMTSLINNKLQELRCVKTEAETYAAMEAVRNIWWTRDKHLPSSKILIERQMDVYTRVAPMLIPLTESDSISAYIIEVPGKTITGKELTDLYQLSFKLNFKFPVHKIFPNELGRTITQHNFDTLIEHAEEEWKYEELKTDPEAKALAHELRKEKRQRLRN
jgi:hypothetical protein